MARISKKVAFLSAFKRTANLTQAAAAVRMDRGQHYDWLDNDPEYPELFRKASVQAAQSLEDEAVERAMVGVFEPTVFQGEFTYPMVIVRDAAGEPMLHPKVIDPDTGEVTGGGVIYDRSPIPVGTFKKSDGLMMFLLRGLAPDKYRERISTEITGKGGGAIEIVERLNAARQRRTELTNGDGTPRDES